MRVRVFVRPNSRRDEVIREGDVLIISVTDPPRKGKANKKVVELLASYFKVKKSQVSIISGHRSREKVVEIEGLDEKFIS